MADIPRFIRARRAPQYCARYADTCGAPRIVDLRRPRSNFDMIENECRGLVTMRRILSQVRQRRRKHSGHRRLERTGGDP